MQGITEIGRNEASAVPSAHFDHISGRAAHEVSRRANALRLYFICAPDTIKIYDSNGHLIFMQTSTYHTYVLDGVGFIQFVGEGTIAQFDVLGFANLE